MITVSSIEEPGPLKQICRPIPGLEYHRRESSASSGARVGWKPSDVTSSMRYLRVIAMRFQFSVKKNPGHCPPGNRALLLNERSFRLFVAGV